MNTFTKVWKAPTDMSDRTVIKFLELFQSEEFFMTFTSLHSLSLWNVSDLESSRLPKRLRCGLLR